jgi:DNA-binding NarL/FixJ family response regulator
MDADQTSRPTEGGKARPMIVAFVDDLMDRSRVRAALGDDVRFARDAGDAREAEVVLVDLARHADVLEALRRAAPNARVVAFGPHVDDAALDAARAAGADAVLPRSRFFRDVAAAVTAATDR